MHPHFVFSFDYVTKEEVESKTSQQKISKLK